MPCSFVCWPKLIGKECVKQLLCYTMCAGAKICVVTVHRNSVNVNVYKHTHYGILYVPHTHSIENHEKDFASIFDEIELRFPVSVTNIWQTNAMVYTFPLNSRRAIHRVDFFFILNFESTHFNQQLLSRNAICISHFAISLSLRFATISLLFVLAHCLQYVIYF